MPPLGFILAIGFTFGVILGSTSSSNNAIAAVLVALVGVTAITSVLGGSRRWLIYCVLAMLAVAVGIIRIGGDGQPSTLPVDDLGYGTFTAVVAEVPRTYPEETYAVVQLDEIEEVAATAQLPPYPEVKQGDVLSIQGWLEQRSEYRGFAAVSGAQANLVAERVTVIDNEPTLPQRFRNVVSEEIRTRVQVRVPEPAGAFTVGMLLGDDGAMTEATRDAFRVGGMTHLTAVSGLHVGIVAGGILLLSRAGILHRWILLASAIPLVWTFAWVVGMRPSVVRASLMLTLFLIAQLLGRPRDTINAVALAGALMILYEPSIRYDIGFQLSVAATLGIALALPLVAGRSYWHAVWVVPLAAEIAVTPLILYHFGHFSLVSPFANILAAPFVVVAMPLGIAVVLSSFASSLFADLVALAAWMPARAVVLIADWAAGIPVLSGHTEPLTLTAVWISYIVLAGVLAVLYVLLHPTFSDPEGDIGTVYRI